MSGEHKVSQPSGLLLTGVHNRAMTRDKREYGEDAGSFRPERFLEGNERRDPSKMAFGFGRRYASIKELFPELNLTYLNASSSVCPGRPFAEDSLWLFVAQFLSVFDILPTDPKALPEARFTDGATP